MSFPFARVGEGRVALEEVEEADVVVWILEGGRGGRWEGECSCLVFLEDMGCVVCEVGGHGCVGRRGGCGGW